MATGTQELQKTETKPVETLERSGRIYSPRADIHETAEAIAVVADLPGVDENSVEITLEKDVLTIKGKKEAAPPEGFKLSYGEGAAGGYERSFVLSERVDRDNIEANVENGVLRLTLPKASEAVPRKIEVKTG